jgi:hypothetical protein
MVLKIETKYTGFYTKNRGYLCGTPYSFKSENNCIIMNYLLNDYFCCYVIRAIVTFYDVNSGSKV